MTSLDDRSDGRDLPQVGLLIAAALHWEAETALGGLRRRSSERGLTIAETAAGAAIAVVVTGMGPELADRAIAGALARVRAAAILSIGCAGALDPTLVPGDVTIATEIRAGSAAPLAVDAGWRARLEAAAARAGATPRSGPFESRAEVLAGIAEKRAVWESAGAIAVEMEGKALAEAARGAGLPFAAVRTILDRADTEIVFARRLLAPDGRLRIGALALALLRGRVRAVRELRDLAAARTVSARALATVMREVTRAIPAVANPPSLR